MLVPLKQQEAKGNNRCCPRDASVQNPKRSRERLLCWTSRCARRQIGRSDYQMPSSVVQTTIEEAASTAVRALKDGKDTSIIFLESSLNPTQRITKETYSRKIIEVSLPSPRISPKGSRRVKVWLSIFNSMAASEQMEY